MHYIFFYTTKCTYGHAFILQIENYIFNHQFFILICQLRQLRLLLLNQPQLPLLNKPQLQRFHRIQHVTATLQLIGVVVTTMSPVPKVVEIVTTTVTALVLLNVETTIVKQIILVPEATGALTLIVATVLLYHVHLYIDNFLIRLKVIHYNTRFVNTPYRSIQRLPRKSFD